MRERYPRAVIDLGTGDGRSVLATAAACPDTLVVGIDANAASMNEASRRAALSAKKGGQPNALFVVAAAEALPAELDHLADRITVQFPWGSLLRGLLAAEPALLDGIARIMRPRAELALLLSVTPRDGVPSIAALDEHTLAAIACRYQAHGFQAVEPRTATPDDLTRSHSTWAKRLGAGSDRAAWLVRMHREQNR